MASRSSEKEAFWRLVIDEQKASGLSIREFCQQESISQPSFYAWRKELQRRDRTRHADTLIPVNVVDRNQANHLQSSPDAPLNNHLEVETPNGFKLRFDHQLETAKLRDVLHVVASCSCLDPAVRGDTSC